MKTKKYVIEMEPNQDGTVNIKRYNEGFNAFELLGIATQIQQDVLKQMSGEIIPEVQKVSRVVIEEEE